LAVSGFEDCTESDGTVVRRQASSAGLTVVQENERIVVV